MILQVSLPLWIPPARYWGQEVKEFYWTFTYKFPKGFFQVTYGLN